MDFSSTTGALKDLPNSHQTTDSLLKKVQKALSFIFMNILNSQALLVLCSGLYSGFTVGTVALFWVGKQVLVVWFWLIINNLLA